MTRRILALAFAPTARVYRLAAFVFAGTVLVGGPALGRSLTLVSEPAAPTWRETIALVVSGTGCGPSLSPPRLLGESTIEVDLVDICDIVSPPFQSPFRLTVDLPKLFPGVYTVRVLDVERGNEASATSLTVYNASRLALELPETPTDSTAPRIRVGAIVDCGYVLDVSVVEQVVNLDFHSFTCAFEPISPPRVEFVDANVPVLPPGDYEVRLIDHDFDDPPGLVRGSMRVWDADGCLPSPTRLCLRDGRFAVDVTWRDFAGGTGSGRVKPLPSNDGSGLVWFFADDNVELTVKLLDGCALNGHWWAFISSLSTVEYDVTVTDMTTHAQSHYVHAAGVNPALITDVEAFPCP